LTRSSILEVKVPKTPALTWQFKNSLPKRAGIFHIGLGGSNGRPPERDLWGSGGGKRFRLVL